MIFFLPQEIGEAYVLSLSERMSGTGAEPHCCFTPVKLCSSPREPLQLSFYACSSKDQHLIIIYSCCFKPAFPNDLAKVSQTASKKVYNCFYQVGFNIIVGLFATFINSKVEQDGK